MAYGTNYRSDWDSIDFFSPYPAILVKPASEPLQRQYREVFLDLETTGLESSWCHIIQLSAVSGTKEFNRYVKPRVAIPLDVTQLTGLRFEDDKMFFRDVEVESVSWKACLEAFWKFLGVDHCILVAHNCKTFDSRILYRSVKSVDQLSELKVRVIGFLDTLPLFRNNYPGIENHRQRTLVSHFLKVSYDVHNAIEDSRNLKLLLEHCGFDWERKRLHTFSLDYSGEIHTFLARKKEFMNTLMPLVTIKILSEYMAEKIAASGLQEKDLRKGYMSGGLFGISLLLSEPHNDGKPRVTLTDRIIKSIFNYYNESL